MVFSAIYDNVVLVLQASILVLAALFPIVNPIADAPIFLGLTEFSTDAQCHALAISHRDQQLFPARRI